jgi:RsiW-degrading membrane proteinase PrsW (M82 family)
MSIELILSIFLAAVPAIIWSLVFLKKEDPNSKLYFLVFLGGTLTVLPLLGMQVGYRAIINANPNLDFVGILKDLSIWVLILYAFVGIMEEWIKFYIVKYIDRTHPELITTTSSAIKFGILSALGFAFSENILYFSRIWMNFGIQELFAPFLFRSTFTVCAHIMFSGIFGYFYGLSKFTDDFLDFKKWQGKEVKPKDYIRHRKIMVALGLGAAIILHGAFNIMLEFGLVIPVIIQVGLMFLFLTALLKRKSVNLVFILADKHKSVMDKKDIDVVLEYMGTQFDRGQYNLVNEIADRLLKRDPDNNVAKLFKSNSLDKLEKQKNKS